MTDGRRDDGFRRRQILGGVTFAALGSWTGTPARAQDDSRCAVVFVSRSSNTRMLAGHLARRLNADLVEVRPRDPWPEDYEEMVAWATRWRESDGLLPLASTPDLSGYRKILVGFPIWGMALPAPMRSLLSGQEFSGRLVLPFVTHGGYGVGSSLDELRGLTPAAIAGEPFVLRCDQERGNLDALQPWLEEIAAEHPR